MNDHFSEQNYCDKSIQIKGSMAKHNSFAGNFHILFDNKEGGPVLRRGYHVWKHETQDIYIHVGSSLKWKVSKKTDFDDDTGRTRDISFIRN